MKKFIFALALVAVFGGFNHTAQAACGDIDPVTNTMIVCGNGPIVPQKFGGRFLKAGQEDCPSWFPSFGGNACYTMRSFGAYFIPLN